MCRIHRLGSKLRHTRRSGIAAWVESSDSLSAAARKVLLIVDVQGKLAHLMHEKEHLFENITKISKGAQSFDVPILFPFNLKRKRSTNTADPPCPMPFALCPLPHALCPML